MRQFIRHPTDIPISLGKPESANLAISNESAATEAMDGKAMANETVIGDDSSLRNISHGGLACTTSQPFAVGENVAANIRLAELSFSIYTQVTWCRADDLGYEVGLRFLNAEDAYAARMVEQVCHIEHYKREVLITEGRQLSGEEAATEWISRFAGHFPNPLDSKDH